MDIRSNLEWNRTTTARKPPCGLRLLLHRNIQTDTYTLPKKKRRKNRRNRTFGRSTHSLNRSSCIRLHRLFRSEQYISQFRTNCTALVPFLFRFFFAVSHWLDSTCSIPRKNINKFRTIFIVDRLFYSYYYR